MKKLVLDLETTVSEVDGRKDNTPFNPNNKMVSAHFCWLGETEVTSLVFHHNDQPVPDDPAPLTEVLMAAEMLIAHNAKFDVGWLVACGFPIPPKIFCTLIGEYVLAKGQRKELSLKAVAARRADYDYAEAS